MDFFKKSPVCILMDLLKNRQDRVVENDRFISWTNENAGNPQGSILELLLFLIYISDLLNGLHSNLKIFCRLHIFIFSLTWSHYYHCLYKLKYFKNAWISSTMETWIIILILENKLERIFSRENFQPQNKFRATAIIMF